MKPDDPLNKGFIETSRSKPNVRQDLKLGRPRDSYTAGQALLDLVPGMQCAIIWSEHQEVSPIAVIYKRTFKRQYALRVGGFEV